MNFKQLKLALEPYAINFIQEWLPGGRLVGREWRCGSLLGGKGDSFGVNIDSQAWGDLNAAEGASGGDLISLYAAIHNVGQMEAAKILADKIGFKRLDDFAERKIIPNCVNQKLGAPKYIHKYTDEGNNLVALVARYEYLEDGFTKKEFRQYSFDYDQRKWVPKGLKSNCPLYKLYEISNNPHAKILIVEGEKTAEAAQRIVGGQAIVTTWMGGSSAVKKTNWTHLTNRDIVIWPDNDEAGIKAANDIATILIGIANTLKVYEVGKIAKFEKKFDAADAEKLGYSKKELFDLLVSSAVILKPLATLAVNKQHEFPSDSLIGKVTKIESAAEVVSHSFQSASIRGIWQDLNLQMNSNGTAPNANAFNVVQILTRYPLYAGKFYEDSFKGRRYYKDKPLVDYDYSVLLYELQGAFGLAKITKSIIIEALEQIFAANKRIHYVEYLDGLTWDEQPRIDRFFIDCVGAHDTNYSEAVSKNFWIAMVKRATSPGIKFDNMVILEGKQGIKKTSLLKLIAGEYYTTIGEDPNNKDFFLKLKGNIIVEIEELDAFKRSEVTTLKRILSTTTDGFRSPYGRIVEEHPRTSIFVGTTNKLDYLSDSTGNRRYWPIECNKVEFDYVEKYRDQLFAEAYVRAKANEIFWEVPLEFMEDIYSKRRNESAAKEAVDDAFYGIVESYVYGKEVVDIGEVLTQALCYNYSQIKQPDSVRIAKILKHLGFSNKVFNQSGVSKRRWIRGKNDKQK